MKTWIARAATAMAGALAIFSPLGRCPVCLSSATGIMGSLGLGLIASQTWFLPLVGAFLLLGLWGAISSARSHGRWHAVWLSAAGAVLLVAGRWLEQGLLLWISAVLLTAGLLLDLYWKRQRLGTRLVRISGIQ